MKRPLLTGALLACAVLLALTGCEKEKSTEVKPNIRPSVSITGGAAERQAEDYKVEFYWFGYDPDGTVDHFDLSIDDPTFASADTTSEFSRSLRFRADSLATSGALEGDFHRWHTFYVRAVDNRGAFSDPAQRTFNAFTIAPFSIFQQPQSSGRLSQFAQTVRFKWSGQDDDSSNPDRKPVGYRYKLVKVPNPLEEWPTSTRPGEWTQVMTRLGALNPDGSIQPALADVNLAWPDSIRSNPAIPDSIKKEWIQIRPSSLADMIEWWNPVTNRWDTIRAKIDELRFNQLESSGYAFSVRSVDEAGAVEPVYVRHLDEDAPGNVFLFESLASIPAIPSIVLFESSLGSFTFPRNGNAVDWEVAAEKPLRFGWTASANDYGGEIQVYNYGWDIPDPSSEARKPNGEGGWIGWGSWTQTLTPKVFPASENGIIHYFYIKVRDTSGTTQIGIARLKVVAFIFDRKVLIIDDFANQNPPDSPQDAFIDRVLQDRFAYADSGEVRWINGPGVVAQEPPFPPTLAELSRYELVVAYHLESLNNQLPYSVLGNLTSADYPQNAAHNPKRRALATYVGAGGKLWVWGNEVTGGLQGDNYIYPKEPFSPSGQETPGDISLFDSNSFLYSFLQIRRGVIRSVRVSTDANAFFGAVASGEAVDRGYPAQLQIDRSRFPDTNRGFAQAESFHGAPIIVAGLDTLYTYKAKQTASSYNGRPTALYYKSPTGAQGDIAYFGFYYYFLQEEQVRQMCGQVFEDLLGE